MNKLKEAVYSNEAYYGSYVSFDSKKCLIFADFFEEELDYTKIKNELDRLRLETEDENTTVSIVGHPMHLGVVAGYIQTMNWIMLGTGILIPILLFVAYRSLHGSHFRAPCSSGVGRVGPGVLCLHGL